MPKRHYDNPNLHLHYDPTYRGMPVQEKHVPMVAEYLEKLYQTLQEALYKYPRVLAFRVDPVIPSVISDVMTVEKHMTLITKFIASLRSIIKWDVKRRRLIKWVPDTKVCYVWCREVGDNGKPHYHFLVILNRGTYYTVGKACSPINNLFNRISRAWYRALELEWNPQKPLIHVPKNPKYRIDRDDAESFQRAFYRASYLCKADTKHYGLGLRAFGTSRS